MSEPVLCFVRIPHPPAKVDAIEAANPEVMSGIVDAATKYMTRHCRAVDADSVIETEEFASQEDFEAFLAEAATALERYDELLGAPVEATVYRILADHTL